MITLAIDPGAKGGLAWQIDNGLIAAEKMPETEGDVYNLLLNLRVNIYNSQTGICYIEKVNGYKGGPSSMFTFGRGVGFLHGVLQSHGWRIEEVSPQKWQKHFSLGTATACADRKEWKNKLKSKAQQLYPGIMVTLETADALLILDWAKAIHP